MTILAAMQSAAVRLVGYRPSAFFGASPNFEMEIADLINEVASDIVASNDWQALTKIATFAGDGTTVLFDKPADYERMLVRSDIQDRNYWLWGYEAISDINDFTFRAEREFNAAPGGWILYGNQFHFTPAPTGDAVFPYISNLFARSSDTLTLKTAFTSDTDDFMLPERMLTLGLIWRWRENKKLDYSGDQEAFTKALSEYAGRDKGSKSFGRSSRRSWPGVGIAYPYPLG